MSRRPFGHFMDTDYVICLEEDERGQPSCAKLAPLGGTAIVCLKGEATTMFVILSDGNLEACSL